MLSDATIDHFVSRSAVPFGRSELSLIAQILVNFGSPWIIFWAMDVIQQVRRSMLRLSNQFFADEVAKVRASTNSASSPAYTQVQPGASFRNFKQLSVNDVVSAIRLLHDKCSTADPIPTYVLKRIANLVALFVAAFFNRSLEYGIFPAAFNQAFITPILKKPGLDSADVNSYRPITNLSVLSELLERLVVRQLLAYLTSADLPPPFQSGFRSGHSAETAVLHVLSDMLSAVDRGDFAALLLLDLSAAFDTVDYDVLLQRLHAGKFWNRRNRA
jgi:hypothetical protein